MKHSRWMKPLIRITSAAVFTSVVSCGISFLLLSNSESWSKLSRQEFRLPYTHAQQDSPAYFNSKGAIHMENHNKTVQLALQQLQHEPELRSIQQAVHDAVNALAKHKPFASWKDAITEIEALGPGTHGFVVHVISVDHKRLGYLIIQATEDGGYSLTEYGTGEYYPFAKDTLSKALQDLGWSAHHQKKSTATPYYLKPMLAVWKLELQEDTHWLDASSGEILPDLSVIQSSVQYASIPAQYTERGVSLSLTNDHQFVTNTPIVHSFDPYDQIDWMSDQALHWSGYHAQQKLQQWNPTTSKDKLIYVQSLKNSSDSVPSINFPYAISGEQLWKVQSKNPNETPLHQKYRYIALTAPGEVEVRYISEYYLLSSGYITASPTNMNH